MPTPVHPLIDPTAQIHPTARVAPQVVVGAHAQIGPGCRLDPFSVVGPHTRLGARCHVHAFAAIGGPAQDRHTDPDAPFRLECGDDNIFREGVTLSRGTERGGGLTRVGHRNLFMAHSHVGHDAELGDDNVLANGVSLAGHVQVGHQVNFGGHSAVHQFVRIGDLAFIAANAMVSQDVPPCALVAGDRATLRGLNRVGLKRAGVEVAARQRVRWAFSALFWQGGGRACAQTLQTDPDPLVRQLALFILSSEREICAVHTRHLSSSARDL